MMQPFARERAALLIDKVDAVAAQPPVGRMVAVVEALYLHRNVTSAASLGSGWTESREAHLRKH
jgi:hypothetical protein